MQWQTVAAGKAKDRVERKECGRQYRGVDLAAELQAIYDSEIDVQIGWLWDGGIEVRLGDDMNGYLTEETFRTVADIVPWLQEAIAHFYPESTYAISLDPELRERAKTRLLLPPRSRAQVICPHCGAPNAGPAMEEVYAFICARCGNSVTVPRPKPQ